MIVIDATVLADFFIGNELHTAGARSLQAEDSGWIAPSLWRYELGNALKTQVKAGRIDSATAQEYLADAEGLVAETVDEFDTAKVLELAIKRGLTMYDASYVWVAITRSLKLRTRDSDVLKYCSEVALPMPNSQA